MSSRWPPRVGQIVHYTAHGTPLRPDGSQAHPSVCRAAVVTQVHDWKAPAGESAHAVGLCVLNPTGMFFNAVVPGHPGDPAEVVAFPGARCLGAERTYPGGTWHVSEPGEED